jgi:hypothetical protein
VPRRRKPARLSIDATEFNLHEPDSPITAFGFSRTIRQQKTNRLQASATVNGSQRVHRPYGSTL